MYLQIALLVIGFVMLIKGADWLVDGGAALGKKYRVSNLTIGLTVVAFGTSAPELVVNAFASFQDHQDIVFGNIIGSNNFNLFFILGIAGLITPLAVQSSTVWKEIPLSLVAAIFMFFMANDLWGGPAVMSRIDGAILLAMFGGFIYYIYLQLKSEKTEPEVDVKNMASGRIALLISFGLATLVFGGKLVVDSAVGLATDLGVSEKVIGLTIIAAGTSLPELATSVIAALKKNNDIAVGNIIGSNIFNIFLILGVSSLIHPIAFDLRFNMDIYLLGAGTVFLFIAMFTGGKRKLDRWEAGLMLAVFLAYMTNLVLQEL